MKKINIEAAKVILRKFDKVTQILEKLNSIKENSKWQIPEHKSISVSTEYGGIGINCEQDEYTQEEMILTIDFLINIYNRKLAHLEKAISDL